jgi:hypothetical protein
MTNDVRLTLQKVIAYCDEKWVKARDEQAAAPAQDIDLQTGKKMAYNDLLQYARKLLSEFA